MSKVGHLRWSYPEKRPTVRDDCVETDRGRRHRPVARALVAALPRVLEQVGSATSVARVRVGLGWVEQVSHIMLGDAMRSRRQGRRVVVWRRGGAVLLMKNTVRGVKGGEDPIWQWGHFS